jgi:hypothetical protein
LYSLAPSMQIVQAMLLEYGETTGTDLQRLRAPLQKPLTSLADLERTPHKQIHAGVQKAYSNWPRKKPLRVLETFLETVRGFPVVTQTLSTFYAAQPAIAHCTAHYSYAIFQPQSPTCVYDG